ncbi:hypothetical protein LTR27_013008 [Elasticomyces elasticus]|nr:hypothetical protein LTR27_013008 [Elasticomyces elasticus]
MEAMEDFVRQTHDELITVRVGSGEGLRDFKLPKALLCARVAWFDSALRDERFLEGKTGVITLPEDDPNIFVAVHYYIYNQTLSFAQIPGREEDSTRAEQIAYCIRVWILGHKYCMVGLQNCAMQRICLLLKEKEDEPLIDNITLKACFSFTAPGSPLRTLAIDYIVDRTSAKGVQTIGEFNDVFACSDGASVEELFDAQGDRNEEDSDFPRYQSPLRHKYEMYVKDAGTTAQADWIKDIILGTQRGSCEDCGIFDGSSWCGVASDHGCNEGECECNISRSPQSIIAPDSTATTATHVTDSNMAPIDNFTRYEERPEKTGSELTARRLLAGDRITVKVGAGENSKTYMVPRNLLTTEPWFEAALQRGNFKEGAEGRISLPEDDPVAFEMFQYFLYNGDTVFERIHTGNEAETDLDRELEQCITAWIFGDKYGIPKLQNSVMLRVCDLLTTEALLLSLEFTSECYAKTSPGSPIRKLVADCIVDAVNRGETVIGHFEGISGYSGFLADVFDAQAAYHQTPDDFPRYTKPVKFKKLFYVDGPELSDAVTTDGYSALWKPTATIDCTDCFLHNAKTVCKACRRDKIIDSDWLV